MKVFLDTSVFVAAFWSAHAQHSSSLRLIKTATPQKSFCAAHTVAEVYSTMTRLPVKPPIPAEHALLFIHQIRERFSVVALTEKEYFSTIERLAENGLAKSYIYDGLIMMAAMKANVDLVYTWDMDDFKRVSPPGMEKKIRTPSP